MAGGYAPQGWGQQQPPAPESGGFLKGALGTAAGVAGGVLLADGIRSLFSHGAGYGGMGNLGIGSGFTPAGGDTVINNYYGDQSGADRRRLRLRRRQRRRGGGRRLWRRPRLR